MRGKNKPPPQEQELRGITTPRKPGQGKPSNPPKKESSK